MGLDFLGSTLRKNRQFLAGSDSFIVVLGYFERIRSQSLPMELLHFLVVFDLI